MIERDEDASAVPPRPMAVVPIVETALALTVWRAPQYLVARNFWAEEGSSSSPVHGTKGCAAAMSRGQAAAGTKRDPMVVAHRPGTR